MRLKHWALAARPKTLAASVIPVGVACALAVRYGVFSPVPAIICLVFALLAQIISNYLNDYYDFKKGADRSDRLGPQRAVAQGWIAPDKMLKVSIALLALAFLLGCSLMFYAGWQLIFVGLGVCLGVFAYSSGPYPLAYHGLGDVCVLVFYGLVPVIFTYYVQALDWNYTVALAGLALGFVSINILVANNYRDREQDKISGKNTSVVLFGEKFGEYFYLFNGLSAALLCQAFWLAGLKGAALLPLLYLAPHLAVWKEMRRIHQGKALNAILGKSARNLVIFGVLLALGILIRF